MHNPDAVALITLDVQNDFTLPGAPAEIPGTSQVIPNIVQLIEAFRAAHAPVIHIVRLYLPDGSNVDLCRREAVRSGNRMILPGTDGAELVEALKPSRSIRLQPDVLLQGKAQRIGDDEVILYKPRWGAFYGTPLEALLRERGIDALVFCGCNFPNCPRASIYEASERDFQIAVAADAVSGIYPQGIRELERIGVTVQETAEIVSWLTSIPHQ